MNKTKHTYLSHEEYIKFREYLRLNCVELSWKDSTTTVFIPSWREYVHDVSVCQDGIAPGIFAFEVLKDEYPSVKLQWVNEEMGMLDRRPPMYFSKPIADCWLGYIDLKSAYYNIYRYLYLDGQKLFKRLRYPLDGIAEKLKDNKPARNALVGITRSTHIKWCKGQEVQRVRKYNRYLSPLLWYHIQGYLAYIASVMLASFHAKYIYTDSYIFNNPQDYLGALIWFSNNSIPITMLESDRANVFGRNNYQIGEKQTKYKEVILTPVNSVEVCADDIKIFQFIQERKVKND
jgi:hypothetical protein